MNLGFYKGYRQSNNYEYFIPLNVIAAPLTPDLYEIMRLLGKDRIISRIEKIK